jgi:methyl coenzyme M reductase gamma subunit
VFEAHVSNEVDTQDGAAVRHISLRLQEMQVLNAQLQRSAFSKQVSIIAMVLDNSDEMN